MSLTLKPPVVVAPRQPRAVVQTIRKIGLCGSHTASLADAPWHDPSWELWGHASSRSWYHRELDRYFELHSPSRWTAPGKKSRRYPEWLAKNTVPIYMQDRHPDVPGSIRYPKGRILQEYGGVRRYFANTTAWMMALAFSEGATTIGLFGIEYGSDSEYVIQRGCAEYWLGRAEERGINLILPEQCTLLGYPSRLYGYESHDENGTLVEEYQRRKSKPEDSIEPLKPGQPIKHLEIPDWLQKQIDDEEADCPRPSWALGPTN